MMVFTCTHTSSSHKKDNNIFGIETVRVKIFPRPALPIYERMPSFFFKFMHIKLLIILNL